MQAHQPQGGDAKAITRHPLFSAAADAVVKNQVAGVSFLQRYLGINFHTASDLLEQLQAAGIVSEFNIDSGWRVLVSALAQPSPAPHSETVYVEARQCDECQHGGINDSAAGLAACHDCDWAGPDPAEDKCPGCQRENCMAAACPMCGGRYVLVASEEVAAQAWQVPEGALLVMKDQIERHSTTAWECPPQSRVVLLSTLQRLAKKNADATSPQLAKGE